MQWEHVEKNRRKLCGLLKITSFLCSIGDIQSNTTQFARMEMIPKAIWSNVRNQVEDFEHTQLSTQNDNNSVAKKNSHVDQK